MGQPRNSNFNVNSGGFNISLFFEDRWTKKSEETDLTAFIT